MLDENNKKEISNLIREEFDKEFGSKLSLLKKILTVPLIIIAALITFIGGISYKNIIDTSEKTAKDRVDEYINKTPQKIFVDEIEQLKENAYINSLFIKMNRGEFGPKTYWGLINDDDIDKISKIILNKNTAFNTFQDAVYVYKNAEDIFQNKNYQSIINAIRKKDYGWIDYEDDRKSILIDLLSNITVTQKNTGFVSQSNSTVFDILNDKSSSIKLKKSAIKYFGINKYELAQDVIESIFENDKSDLNNDALIYLCIQGLDSTNKKLNKWFAGLKSKTLSCNDAVYLLKVAQLNESLSQEVYTLIIDNNFKFEGRLLDYSNSTISISREYDYKTKLPACSQPFDSKLLFDKHGYNGVANLLNKMASADNQKFQKVLKTFYFMDVLQRAGSLIELFFSPGFNDQKKPIILTEGNQEIFGQLTDEPFVIKYDRHSGAIACYKDANGKPVEKKILGFKNLDRYNFGFRYRLQTPNQAVEMK